MKYIVLFLLITGIASSCSSQKRIIYLQDVDIKKASQIAADYQIKIKPLDRLTVVVNSKNPELAAPFNSATSYNSLSGSQFSSSTSGVGSLQVRTVDEEGYIDMPIIGKIGCVGKTRSQLASEIAEKIKSGGYISDPNVNIQFVDMKISVIGEVTKPGVYNITTDRISLFDALAMAGDLTIFGMRNGVIVIREDNGIRTTSSLDLTSEDIYTSPYFYLQQNDVVYVKQNKYKAQAGEISQNRNFYLSLIGTAISVATLIVTLTK